jgi:hypothetical protein
MGVERDPPALHFTARDSLAGAGRDPEGTSSRQPRVTRLMAPNLEGSGDGRAAFAPIPCGENQRTRIAIRKRTATMGVMTFRAVAMTIRRDVGKRSATTGERQEYMVPRHGEFLMKPPSVRRHLGQAYLSSAMAAMDRAMCFSMALTEIPSWAAISGQVSPSSRCRKSTSRARGPSARSRFESRSKRCSA